MPQQPPQKEGFIRHSTVILHSPSGHLVKFIVVSIMTNAMFMAALFLVC